ncbi:ABC transporter transmembrane region [Peptoniphilus gorbachii]|uniref:ABC transporter transmembrane region n=1 Tax=Peptoniphilus gorbachii TaxID=411567 RepID=A0A6N3CJY1_9FIRM
MSTLIKYYDYKSFLGFSLVVYGINLIIYHFSLKRKIVEKTFKLPLKFFDIRPSGEIISRINNIDLLQHSITNMIMAIFIDLLTIIISSLAMIKVSRDLAIINFILGFILCIIVFVLLKIVDKKT